MKTTCVIHPDYQHLRSRILDIPRRFPHEGTLVYQARNTLKAITVDGITLNVKSYRPPHLVNRVAYAYLRPTKAERSYRYAQLLLSRGIPTPRPVAYIVQRDTLGVTHSYYISLQLHDVFEFRDLRRLNPPDLEPILLAFTRFTHHLHQLGIHFIDHSPGNTLIHREPDGTYTFYLVDLNRLRLRHLTPLQGLRNFRLLNATPPMIRVIATEYARLTRQDPDEMTRLLTRWTARHDARVAAKQARRARHRH